MSTRPRPFVYNPPASPFLAVLFRDDDLLVLDKPAGLLTVPGKDPALADCLEARAQSHFPGARVVHRLDKDTSGVIVMALNAEIHAALGLQFEKRQTEKSYIARVWGRLAEDRGTVDAPLRADWPNRPRQHVDRQAGRHAVTHWEVLEREENATRLRLTPVTGRSHQLRVHMLHIGHPILGDNLYAHDEALACVDRLQLHASRLALSHPADGVRHVFEAGCPF